MTKAMEWCAEGGVIWNEKKGQSGVVVDSHHVTIIMCYAMAAESIWISCLESTHEW